MKILNLAIYALLCSITANGAEEVTKLFPFGSMEKVTGNPSRLLPEGWFSVGAIEFESDADDFKSGTRSLKIRTPDKPAVISSKYIPVQPNTPYEIEASVLARGDNPASRPFVGLRVQGNRLSNDSPDEEKYLIIWTASDEEVGFVTKKARFITDGDTYKVRVTLLVRNRPPGIVNVDDVILRIADQTE